MGVAGAVRKSVIAATIVSATLAVPAFKSAATTDTIHVVAGGDVSPHPIDLQSYYPRDAIVHVGDQVAFDFRGFHTVTFVPAGAKVPAPIVPADGVFPAHNDEAHKPFWWGGIVPRLQFNTAAAFPSPTNIVDGNTFVNSGLPQGPAPFVANFPKAGRFEYHCAIHAFMHGFVTVAPHDATIPSADAQRRLGRSQRNEDARAALAMETKMSMQTSPNSVTVGAGTKRFSLLEFFAPSSVHVGDLVTFNWTGFNEVHTATFGDHAYVTNLENTLIPPPPPPMILNPVGALPSDVPGTPITLTLATHGNGFLNSGILGDPPIPSPGGHSYQMRFGAPGTYHVGCLIHPFMESDITVTA